MKKFFIIFFITISILADINEIEKEIYSTIIKAIFPNSKDVKVWIDEDRKKDIFSKIDFIKLQKDYKDAKIVFIFKEKTLKEKKEIIKKAKDEKIIIFVGKYSLLKNYQDIAIGGFFWQKGRPNIIFLRENLKRFNINLPKSFDKYIEDRV